MQNELDPKGLLAAMAAYHKSMGNLSGHANAVETAIRTYLSAVPDGEGEAWPKDPETGMNDLSLTTLLKQAAPQPAPVVTQEMVDRIMRKADDLDMCMTSDDAEELLTAALQTEQESGE